MRDRAPGFIHQLVADAIRGKQHVTVILGAGASAEAGIPTGSQVADKLRDESDRRLLAHELGEKRWDFFDVIDVLSRYRGEEEARARLREALRPTSISLGYEIIAHYLHRGDISAVLTLNHDDAFDECLRLEMSGHAQSESSLHEARSRSDFDALLDKIIPAAKGELPDAYLKVHGCVSKKLTFRIDREAIAKLEKEKVEVLKRYLDESDLILCIGWAMRDPDVFRLLSKAISGRARLVVVNRSPVPAFYDLVEGIDGIVCAEGASAFLSEVGNLVEAGKSPGPGTPGVGLHRHRIRALCFGQDRRLEMSAEAQAAIEIIMFALKSRAQIEPRTLFECSRTSRLLGQAAGASKAVPIDQAQVSTLGNLLRHLCEKGILEKYPRDDGSIYWLRSRAGGGSPEAILEAIASNVAENLVRSKYWEADPDIRRDAKDDAHWRATLSEHLKALTTAFDVDLIPRARDFALFSSPLVLGTKDDFSKATGRIVRSRKRGATLCVSANTGEWLSHYLEHGPVEIEACNLLVEDYGETPDRNPFKAIARGRIEQVRSCFEQRDIPITVKQARAKVHQFTAIEVGRRFYRAIYFRREGKSTRISPVMLREREDLDLAHRLWTSLWNAAEPLTAAGRQGA